MKNPLCKMATSMILGTIISVHCSIAVAQNRLVEPVFPGRNQPNVQRKTTSFRPTVQRDGNVVSSFSASSNTRQMTIRALASALKDASADEREDIESKISAELEKQYEQFLIQNEKQIEQLQQRIDKLKDQLDRRRKAASKMLELEFERVINEADGLIWPGQNEAAAPTADVHIFRNQNPFGQFSPGSPNAFRRPVVVPKPDAVKPARFPDS